VEGEVFLVYHPVRRGWAGFAVTMSDVIQRTLPEIDITAPPARLSEALLVPFTDILATARRIRFLPYGPLDRLDLHALPWRDAPLLTFVPVTYGIDVPGRRVERASSTSRPTALVVADPRSDLPAAREEAQVVIASLERSKAWSVDRIWGKEATSLAVRNAIELADTDLLHYAGHGVFEGRDGLESGLLIAEGSSLSVTDILTLSRVPRRVVLSGCETARTAPEARAEGLGLAQAFVVAGASTVIAATRPVSDTVARSIMSALHDAAPDDEPEDIAAALQRAEVVLSRSAPDADWSSFRVLVP